MLTMTTQALDVIRLIPEDARFAETAGLRIERPAGADSGFTVQPTDRPEAADQVVDQDGARVFLDPTAAQRLQGSELDAQFDISGRVHFHASSPQD